MLVNAKEMIEKANSGSYAVLQFNINNLEWTKYILEAAEASKKPVILGVSEGAAKYMGGYKTIVGMVNGLIEELEITIPVALHLDHGSSFECCKEAIDAGFSSVMIDASKYDINTNIEITSKVIEYASKYNVSVEAEVGHVGGQEDGAQKEILYASPIDCLMLVEKAKVDFLAPALGSVHGLYQGEPNLQFDLMKKIKEEVKIPLVLHGGTGIPDDLVKRAIGCGVNKINFNTELQIAWSTAVRKFLVENQNAYDPRKIIGSGSKAIKDVVNEKMMLYTK